jgi:UDP-glucuronate 4-epimerase
LMRYIEVLESCLGRKAQKNMLPMQPGDLPDTWADVTALARDVGYRPSTQLEQGVKHFVEWYLAYYHPRTV